MLLLGVPVIDGHELTQQLCQSLADTIADPASFRLFIIDNDSEVPYKESEFRGLPFVVSVIHNDKNRGYYYPITLLAQRATSADLVGLVHNDLIFYSEGWDVWVRQEFVGKPDLGMVGVCGSNELDDRGGRGGGTMCNFRGVAGARTEDTGLRITRVEPAVILDSMVMITRQSLVHHLKVDDNTPICHFLDKVWPLRLYEAGYKTAVMGIEVDHMGGQTAVALKRYHEAAAQWCLDRGIDDGGDASHAVYIDSETRFLNEFRAKHLVPSRMRGWDLVRG